jgi:hypothetical protein
MSLPNYLSKIKSAGIYRFVFDKSEVPGEQAETMRLVVGYSEKGPFNTLVYIESISEFETIFGGVNKKLERRGCFFHRLAEQALGTGPILAINLKPFDTDKKNPELVTAASFDVTDRVSDHLAKLGIEDIYDTTRFWHLEPEGLGERFAKKNQSHSKYITITAADSVDTTNTVFFRGYHPKGYDISFKEWYSSVLNGEELPSYMEGHEMDKVSEYFAECYIFRGKFTPEIATSEALAKYFDVDGDKVTLKPYILNAFGEKKDTLVALAGDTNSNFVNSYSGILLPNFITANGGYISLDLMFNSGNDNHKMMMNLNVDALYDGEITIDKLNTTGWEQVGKELENGTAIGSIKLNSMSAEGVTPVVSRGTYTDGKWEYTDPEPATFNEPDFYSFDIDNAEFVGYTMKAGKEITEIGRIGDKFIVKTTNSEDSEVAVVTSINEVAPEEKTAEFEYINDAASWNESYQNGALKKYYEKYPEEDCWNTAENRACNYNDRIYEGTVDGNEVTATVAWASSNAQKITIDGVEYYGAIFYGFTPQDVVLFNDINLTESANKTLAITSIHYSDDCDHSFAAVDPRVLPWIAINFDEPFNGVVKMSYDSGDFVYPWGEEPREMSFGLASVPEEFGNQYNLNDGTETFDDTKLEVIEKNENDGGVEFVFDREITGLYNDELIRCNHPVYETCQGLTPVAFEGYTYGLKLPSSDMMDKLNWQKAILDTLTKYEGIRMALTNRKDSEYHYLVDTFESFVQTELKSTFGVIAKEKDNCLALVNFPSIKTFKDCPYSSYTDSNGKFQTKYIAEGYNKQKPASVYFSLMSEFNGASFVSYNTPVVLTDGTVKTYCPSAALVSNCFMAKYDTRLPYSIVAGPTYGRITATGLVGPDFNFSRADLDILEPMGVNCMVYVPRKGTYINANQTAKQNPVTALSKINVRELVIFLQDEIENLMQNYQWEYNTQELRDTIKSKADTICEKIKANGGLYEYVNVCDDSNNTPEIIDNEMIILDTSIEPGRGAGKMVQRLYIYRTGALKAMMS